MQQGGVRFWLITGDHVTTSIQIARHCGILRGDDTRIVRLEGTSDSEIRQKWDAIQQQSDLAEMCLVLTGHSLAHILTWPVCRDFFKTAILFDSVLCCRVTPKQKVSYFL